MFAENRSLGEADGTGLPWLSRSGSTQLQRSSRNRVQDIADIMARGALEPVAYRGPFASLVGRAG
jgi:hypothetical protein